MPGEGYRWHWSVYGWLPGENAAIDRLADPGQAATDRARFIAALHRIDATGGPPRGEHHFGRGVPLASRDAPVHGRRT
jgi:aminoglycoside phosphotransferase (APT) family kinase protein